jgi:hypothetical protein
MELFKNKLSDFCFSSKIYRKDFLKTVVFGAKTFKLIFDNFQIWLT